MCSLPTTSSSAAAVKADCDVSIVCSDFDFANVIALYMVMRLARTQASSSTSRGRSVAGQGPQRLVVGSIPVAVDRALAAAVECTVHLHNFATDTFEAAAVSDPFQAGIRSRVAEQVCKCRLRAAVVVGEVVAGNEVVGLRRQCMAAAEASRRWGRAGLDCSCCVMVAPGASVRQSWLVGHHHRG